MRRLGYRLYSHLWTVKDRAEMGEAFTGNVHLQYVDSNLAPVKLWRAVCCELAPHMIEDYTGWLIMSHHRRMMAHDESLRGTHSLTRQQYVVHVVNVAKVHINIVVIVFLSKQ
jgi:hypothetical protein